MVYSQEEQLQVCRSYDCRGADSRTWEASSGPTCPIIICTQKLVLWLWLPTLAAQKKNPVLIRSEIIFEDKELSLSYILLQVLLRNESDVDIMVNNTIFGDHNQYLWVTDLMKK